MSSEDTTYKTRHENCATSRTCSYTLLHFHWKLDRKTQVHHPMSANLIHTIFTGIIYIVKCAYQMTCRYNRVNTSRKQWQHVIDSSSARSQCQGKTAKFTNLAQYWSVITQVNVKLSNFTLRRWKTEVCFVSSCCSLPPAVSLPFTSGKTPAGIRSFRCTKVWD